MKKGLILGAAALAAVSVAVSSADAGEVKMGGYYRVQGVTGDLAVIDGDRIQANGSKTAEDTNYYRHRLHINMDMIASEKTAAHMHFRPVDNLNVEGGQLGDGMNNAAVENTTTGGAYNAGEWRINRLWIETEAAGIGIKAGEMPLSLNDGLLYNDDGDNGVGAVILSKTFGGVTVMGGNIKMSEGTTTINSDDVDAYLAGVMGKGGSVSYNANLVYLQANAGGGNGNTKTAGPNLTSTQVGDGGTVQTETDNWWLAATIGAKLGGIDLTVTGSYEAGYDNYDQIAAANKTALTEQLDGSGYLLAAKLSGSAGFGGWKAFAYYASEDYNAMSNKPNWNYLHNSNGPTDLMRAAMTDSQTGAASAANSLGATTNLAIGELENTHGIGAELSIKAGNFTINPGIEYMAVTEDRISVNGTTYQADIDSAWGGFIGVSTTIDTGTTLSVTGSYVDPDANKADALMPSNIGIDSIHMVVAEIRMNF
jgi:hypothetical protein